MSEKEKTNFSSKELGVNKVEPDKISEWYNKIIKEAEVVDQGPTKGTIVFRPYGYALWKGVQKNLGSKIEENGVKDVYFPAIIPERLLVKEKDHIEGFAPEFLRVQGRSGEIGVLRPTSEAVMYPLFKKWINSYRDLPLKVNQWCNTFRDELRTYALIRTSEFLWQEGHCVYSSAEENERAVMKYLNMYRDFFDNKLAISPIFGKKSEKEKFAGALYTTTGEALLPGGKALQVCTSHNLGTNFAEAFNIQFLGKDSKQHYPYQTSWGLSWRVIAAMIMIHGDEKGLVFPPEMAPIQVVIIPIRGSSDELVMKTARSIKEKLSGLRVKLDESNSRPGALYNYYEIRGIPLRIEIGARDIGKNQLTVANRLTGKKETLPLNDKLNNNINSSLDSIQRSLLEKSEDSVKENIRDVKTWKEFKDTLNEKGGFLRTYHCGDRDCEQKIQDETKATLRCIPFGYEKSKGKCVKCGKPSGYGQKVLFAKAY